MVLLADGGADSGGAGAQEVVFSAAVAAGADPNMGRKTSLESDEIGLEPILTEDG